MKRELDLIRKILQAVEADQYEPTSDFTVDGYDSNTVAFHLELLQQAGYLNIKTEGSLGYAPSLTPQSLTWEGYEFLALARNESAWQKSKSFLKEKSITVSVPILTEVLKSIIKDTLGLK